MKQSYTLAVRYFLKQNQLILWRSIMENMEIERKFLVKKIPDNLDTYERIDMIQGYLNTAPVVRVRKENDDYVLTYKGSGLLSHSEYNLPLNKESFEHLLKNVTVSLSQRADIKFRLKIILQRNLIFSKVILTVSNW